MTQSDKSQTDKTQTDRTKNQLVEGMRKSKAAGATPGRAAERATRPQQGGADNRYALGGLRWPD